MSQQATPPQAPLPNFALEGIGLVVKSAKRTHQFLTDVFAQPNTLNRQDPLILQKGQLPQLSQDGKHTDFRMCNTAIRFSTAPSSYNFPGGHNMLIKLHVQDIAHVKKVLDQHNWKYRLGQEAAPERVRWIEFKDPDGYFWHVSEVRKY